MYSNESIKHTHTQDSRFARASDSIFDTIISGYTHDIKYIYACIYINLFSHCFMDCVGLVFFIPEKKGHINMSLYR